MFHTWVGIGILSTAIDRSIYVDRAYYKLYPNLYIVLVADSARLRKSVSIGIGVSLLRKALPDLNIFAQKITAEALIKTLQATYKSTGISSGMIQADELSVFLGKTQETSIIPILTTLYDSKDKWDYLTIGRGKETCNNTYLTMLAGSTPKWLKDALPSGSIGGGFTSRINFVYQSSTDRSFAHPKKTKKEMDLEKYLIEELKKIHKIKGIMEWSKEAEDAYSDWYTTLYDPDKADDGLQGYYGRKHDVLIKLATIISISRSDDLIIEGDDLATALEVLNANEVYLPEIMSIISSSEKGEVTHRILGTIERWQPVTYSQLLRRCWRFTSSKELQEQLETLLGSGVVREKIEGGKRYYVK